MLSITRDVPRDIWTTILDGATETTISRCMSVDKSLYQIIKNFVAEQMEVREGEFLSMPKDIWVEILSHLTKEELSVCLLTSKKINYYIVDMFIHSLQIKDIPILKPDMQLIRCHQLLAYLEYAKILNIEYRVKQTCPTVFQAMEEINTHVKFYKPTFWNIKNVVLKQGGVILPSMFSKITGEKDLCKYLDLPSLVSNPLFKPSQGEVNLPSMQGVFTKNY